MKKYFITLLFIIIITPSVAFASWWNPLSWFNDWTFRKTEVFPQVQLITTDEPINNLEEKTKLEAELEQAKAETVKAKIEAEKARKEANEAKRLADVKPEPVKLTPPSIETWQEQEVRDFAYADARGWTSLISTNTLGEKRYYRKERDLWVRKNSEAEAQEAYSPPVSALGSRVQEIEACLKDLNETEKSQNLCDDPTYSEFQKAACGLASSGLRTSQSTKLSLCMGSYPTPSYSSPPAYTPPPSYSRPLWEKEYEEDKFRQSVCEKAGGMYLGTTFDGGSCI